MVDLKILRSREEWLEERKNCIGGSDASAIVGMNPYKTNVDLWLEKTGQVILSDISDKNYVKYGTEAEEHLRALFALDYPNYKVHYVENNMIKNTKYPFLHASLDGWLEDENGKKGILEIKTTNILQSIQKEKWNGRVPNNYYIQILHYLLVTELDFAILKAQLKTEFSGEIYLQTKHYYIDRTEVQDDIDYLLKAEEKFWKQVKSNTRPDLVLPNI